ncbi:MAG: helix-turn-helix transcriptional regulator [Ruminococcus flavefaciens]|nr:helix-turn-helix transcriptional regulator [Ruminococcus flavefaciens]
MVWTKTTISVMLFSEVINIDLIITGKFIAQLRKEQHLTQEQLGEIIGVTNKTVSRWETGVYLPPADALMIMSETFNVSINEILSGKRLTNEEYKETAEENLVQTIKNSRFSLQERIDFYRKKWLKEHMTVMLMLGFFILALTVAGLLLKKFTICYSALIILVSSHCCEIIP